MRRPPNGKAPPAFSFCKTVFLVTMRHQRDTQSCTITSHGLLSETDLDSCSITKVISCTRPVMTLSARPASDTADCDSGHWTLPLMPLAARPLRGLLVGEAILAPLVLPPRWHHISHVRAPIQISSSWSPTRTPRIDQSQIRSENVALIEIGKAESYASPLFKLPQRKVGVYFLGSRFT